MKRLRDLFYFKPTPPLNDGLIKAAESLGEATKDLEIALKEIEIALDKLEELSRLRREIAKQATSGPTPQPTPSKPHRTEEEDDDPTFRSVPVYTSNAIVPVISTLFFRH